MSSKLEELLNSLEALAGQHPNEPEAVAKYERVFGTSEHWPKPLRSFNSEDEARSWLRTQSDVPYAAVVEMAGSLHSVARTREGEWVLVRLPSSEELER